MELNQLRPVSWTAVGAGQPDGTVTAEEAGVVEDGAAEVNEAFEVELVTLITELVVFFEEILVEVVVKVAGALVDVILLPELVDVVLEELNVVDVVDDKHALS